MKFLVFLSLVAVALATDYYTLTMYYGDNTCADNTKAFMQEWYIIPTGEAKPYAFDCAGVDPNFMKAVLSNATQPTITIATSGIVDFFPADTCTGTVVGQMVAVPGIVPIPSVSVVPCDGFAQCCPDDSSIIYDSMYAYCLPTGDTVAIECYDTNCFDCMYATVIDDCTSIVPWVDVSDYYYKDSCVDSNTANGYMRVTMYDTDACTTGTESGQYTAQVNGTLMCSAVSCLAGMKIECSATALPLTQTFPKTKSYKIYMDDQCTVEGGSGIDAPVISSTVPCDPLKECCQYAAGVYATAACQADGSVIASVCTDAACTVGCTAMDPMGPCYAMGLEQQYIGTYYYKQSCTGSMLTAAVAILSLFFALF